MRKTNMMIALMTTVAIMPRAFENKAGWKLDADGKIEMKDGHPVYINSAGVEQTVSGDTIANLNAEAKGHRTAKETAEAELAKYKGADGKPIDPEAAKKALDTVSKIDAKTLIDAGEVDKVRDQIKAEFTGQLTERDAKIIELTSNYDNLQIDNIFTASDFVRDNIAVPFDMFQATFRKNFAKDDKGNIIAKDRAGNPLMSKERVGEYADPNEALKLLVDSHPQKDTILKAPAAGGSGNGGGGGGRGGGAVIKRAAFDALTPGEQAATVDRVNKGEVQLVD